MASEFRRGGSTVIGRHATPSSVWRPLFLLLAVVGVIVGILGMHTLVSGPADSMSPHAALHSALGSDHPGEESTKGTDAGRGMAMGSSTDPGMDAHAHCAAGGCGPGHDMSAMLCFLALLATVLLLLAPILMRSRWAFFAAIAARAREVPRIIAPASPPSLHVLSISRT
ncbi:DUF6153 family protein [Leifsonia soli]|uniref:Uncharacterized protein n=1 Tax=Leifsonia soli TaxID=582665 RepID=A0A852T4W5_9MICO|nr:hypothetical protein [Leifsonia soli]